MSDCSSARNAARSRTTGWRRRRSAACARSSPDALGSPHDRSADRPRGAVLTITLNRPEVFNAFNAALHAGLHSALEAAGDPEVRAVVITGAGRGFCSGQDLKEFQEVSGSIRERLEATYHPNIRLIRGLEKPVIAAVNGPCAGAAFRWPRRATSGSRATPPLFTPGFIGIGLVPDSGGSWFIHRLLGFARAFEWMTSNRKLTAAEAHAWGLVSEVVDAEQLAGRAGELAARYAEQPTRGIGLTKRLFDHAYDASLDEQLELEAELQQAATGTPTSSRVSPRFSRSASRASADASPEAPPGSRLPRGSAPHAASRRRGHRR